jgi:hypothetical protein
MATRTISDAGGVWSTAATWVENAVPTSSDDVVATSTSGNISLTTVNGSCLSLDLSNYNGTITMSTGRNITVSGSITYGPNMSFSLTGTAIIIMARTGTLTTNGKIVNFKFSPTAAATYTLADDVHVNNTTQSAIDTTSYNATFEGPGNLYFDVINAPTIIGNYTTITANTNLYLGSLAQSTTTGTYSFAGTSNITFTKSNFNATATSTTINCNANINFGNVIIQGNRDMIFSASSSRNISMTSITTRIASLTTDQILYITINQNILLTITNSLFIVNGYDTSYTNSPLYTIRSSSTSNPTTINYTGPLSNMVILDVAFTDVTATNPLYVMKSRGLTRTTNIVDYDLGNLPPALASSQYSIASVS